MIDVAAINPSKGDILFHFYYIVIIINNCFIMNDIEIYKKLKRLSPPLKKEADDFIEFLLSKKERDDSRPKRPLGLAKGLIEMNDDFDDPLDDFKEYDVKLIW